MSSKEDILSAHEYAMKELHRLHFEEYQKYFKENLRILEGNSY